MAAAVGVGGCSWIYRFIAENRLPGVEPLRGTFGVVVLCKPHPDFGEAPVAIKRLDDAGNAEFIRNTTDEYNAMLTLNTHELMDIRHVVPSVFGLTFCYGAAGDAAAALEPRTDDTRPTLHAFIIMTAFTTSNGYLSLSDCTRSDGCRARVSDRIGRALLQGIVQIHKRCGITHNDIKPDNIITHAASGRGLFIDWGSARMHDDVREGHGTLYYLSPHRARVQLQHAIQTYCARFKVPYITTERVAADGPHDDRCVGDRWALCISLLETYSTRGVGAWVQAVFGVKLGIAGAKTWNSVLRDEVAAVIIQAGWDPGSSHGDPIAYILTHVTSTPESFQRRTFLNIICQLALISVLGTAPSSTSQRPSVARLAALGDMMPHLATLAHNIDAPSPRDRCVRVIDAFITDGRMG